MGNTELQQLFFQQIKSELPAHLSIAEEVADLLDISTDSAYRRIRGEKPITFEEIKKLSSHFHISLDQVMNIYSGSTLFYGNWVEKENFNFESYLKDMLFQLQQMEHADKKQLYFEAKDIPPFHHFQFPELAAFKYFFWMRTILGYERLSKSNFESHDLKSPLQDIGRQIIKTYNQIPSIEIWSVETINSTIRQIEYYRQAEVFKKKDSIAQLYEQLEQLINHIEAQAECGEKFLIGDQPSGNQNFQLFVNEVILGHNTLLLLADDVKTVFINHGVLNYMITRDQKFCDYTLRSLQNIMRKSALISSVSEKERNRFFHTLKERIAQHKSTL